LGGQFVQPCPGGAEIDRAPADRQRAYKLALRDKVLAASLPPP
jgi:hypothetical protein